MAVTGNHAWTTGSMRPPSPNPINTALAKMFTKLAEPMMLMNINVAISFNGSSCGGAEAHLSMNPSKLSCLLARAAHRLVECACWHHPLVFAVSNHWQCVFFTHRLV